VLTWQGLVAPTGTPKEIIDRLNAELVKALKDPEFASRMRGMGLELYGTTPAQFAKFIRDETPSGRRSSRRPAPGSIEGSLKIPVSVLRPRHRVASSPFTE